MSSPASWTTPFWRISFQENTISLLVRGPMLRVTSSSKVSRSSELVEYVLRSVCSASTFRFRTCRPSPAEPRPVVACSTSTVQVRDHSRLRRTTRVVDESLLELSTVRVSSPRATSNRDPSTTLLVTIVGGRAAVAVGWLGTGGFPEGFAKRSIARRQEADSVLFPRSPDRPDRAGAAPSRQIFGRPVAEGL